MVAGVRIGEGKVWRKDGAAIGYEEMGKKGVERMRARGFCA